MSATSILRHWPQECVLVTPLVLLLSREQSLHDTGPWHPSAALSRTYKRGQSWPSFYGETPSMEPIKLKTWKFSIEIPIHTDNSKTSKGITYAPYCLPAEIFAHPSSCNGTWNATIHEELNAKERRTVCFEAIYRPTYHVVSDDTQNDQSTTPRTPRGTVQFISTNIDSMKETVTRAKKLIPLTPVQVP